MHVRVLVAELWLTVTISISGEPLAISLKTTQTAKWAEKFNIGSISVGACVHLQQFSTALHLPHIVLPSSDYGESPKRYTQRDIPQRDKPIREVK